MLAYVRTNRENLRLHVVEANARAYYIKMIDDSGSTHYLVKDSDYRSAAARKKAITPRVFLRLDGVASLLSRVCPDMNFLVVRSNNTPPPRSKIFV